MRRGKGYTNLLIISHLDIWTFGTERPSEKKIGNQTLFNTILGYARNNYKVYFLTSGDEYLNLRAIGVDNVTIIRSKYATLRKAYKRVRDKIKKFLSKKRCKESEIRIDEKFGNVMLWITWGIWAFFESIPIILLKRPDIIYGYEVYSILPSFLLGKLFKIPVVARYQGTPLAMYLNDKNLTLPLSTRFTYILSYRIPVDLIIMGNDGTRGDLILSRIGVPKEKIKFWLNGVDAKYRILNSDLTNRDIMERREKEGIPSDSIVLISACRLVSWKRVDRIILVLRELVKKNYNIFLMIIGDGPQRLVLENLVEKLDVRDRVRFFGKVPRDKVIEYLRISDIYVSAFEMSNLSNTLLEAMTCGKCVVVLNNGETSSVVSNGKTGFLVDPPFTLSKFTEILVKLISNSSLRKEVGERAKEYARNNFLDWSERMNLEVQEINKLIESFSIPVCKKGRNAKKKL